MSWTKPNITSPSNELTDVIQLKINTKTKPLNSLGALEDIALKLALIQNTDSPTSRPAAHIVFAADHGVTAEGISPFPSEVTQQMVLNFVGGGAAINAFCTLNNVAMSVVDAGVKLPFDADLPIVHAKVSAGTANFAIEVAMTEDQCRQALALGQTQVLSAIEAGNKVVSFGEMGIGNTTSSAAIMSVITGLDANLCVGAGTGSDSDMINHKAAVIEKAIKFHQLDTDSKAFFILQAVGGLEIAAITGAMLAAADNKTAFIVDGFIATAAYMIAHKMQPNISEYAFFGHQSNESGHKRMLDFLNETPLLQLGLALGEGTGAVLALPLLDAACAFMQNMASFADAGVSDKA
jgi:nicotinate-nucleotide--dimethylbenzimidazole phosphoribosyltransferase